MQSARSLLGSPRFHWVLPLVSSVPPAIVQIPDVASAGFEQHLHGPAFEKENLIKTFLAHIVSVAINKKKVRPYFPLSLSGRRYSVHFAWTQGCSGLQTSNGFVWYLVSLFYVSIMVPFSLFKKTCILNLASTLAHLGICNTKRLLKMFSTQLIPKYQCFEFSWKQSGTTTSFFTDFVNIAWICFVASYAWIFLN